MKSLVDICAWNTKEIKAKKFIETIWHEYLMSLLDYVSKFF